jgi:hypothetical protein
VSDFGGTRFLAGAKSELFLRVPEKFEEELIKRKGSIGFQIGGHHVRHFLEAQCEHIIP